MPNEPISVFISYSRTDSDFVDRLEADLRARNFPTWVDRHKLEGGQIWIEELEKAIQRCHVLLVVLSPEAVVSEFVRKEYRYAQNLKKPVIPLLYRAIPSVPLALNDIQWIKFNPDTYGQGLNDLLIALNPIEIKAITEPQPSPIPTSLPPEPDPSHEEPVLVAPQPAPPPPEPNLNDLYKAGVMAKVEDNLERTAILWQQILDRDPYFKDGTLAPQLKLLLDKLYLIRVQRLRDQAEQAHLAGELGQEIGAWRALLGLEPEDIQAKARIVQYFRQQAEQAHSAGEWKQEVNALQALLGVEPKEARALERISVAEHNQKNVWLYENAQQFVEDGYLSSAKMQLEMLWQNAPYFGDPAGLAKKVGMEIPPNPAQGKGCVSRRTVIVAGLAGLAVVVLAGAGGVWETLAPHPLYTYHGHSDRVLAVAWSPNGKRIASGSYDKTVQVWDAVDGGHIYTYRGHSNGILAVAWSPDGKLIASGGYTGPVQVWDAVVGNVCSYCKYPAERAVVWSPDGKRIASVFADADTIVKVWYTTDGSLAPPYNGHTGNGVVSSIAWSPNGSHIASGSYDKTVQVWDATNGANTVTYLGHYGKVTAAAWSPDSKYIASGGDHDDPTVRVWDATTGNDAFIYKGHSDAITAVAWSPDGKRIASSSDDKTVQVWDAFTGNNVFTYHGHTDKVNTVVWSPDGKLLTSGSDDRTVQVWQVR